MKLNSSIKKEKEVDMLELFLMTILISAMEPLNCDGTDEVPSVVRKMLPQITAGENTAVIEISEQTGDGYISSLFLITRNDRTYLEGWFYFEGESLIVCDIAQVRKIDNEGRMVFIWFVEQKDL
jgi:hypothetical protein